jgi:Ca2+-binding RTX toxin-like protein
MTGGLGDDIFIVNSVLDVVVEAFGEGTDEIRSGAVFYTLSANVENLVLTGAGSNNGTGNALNNILTGNSGNNVLDGGVGADTMTGGLGNDTFVVNSVLDVVVEAAGQGTDVVQSGAVSHTLSANVENLVLTGAGSNAGTGNTLNNILTGNSGNNVLNGGAGNDTMIGGVGNDTYVRDAVGDVLTELAGQGTDTVQSSLIYTLLANFENLTLTGVGNINGTGNAVVNVLTGNSGNNVLNGGAGADVLSGMGGNDTLVWDASDTTVDGGVGSDTLTLAGAGLTLNLLTVANSKIQNVEVINLTGSGNNRLELSLQDVLDLSSTSDTLQVAGNAGDVVDRNAGWTLGANQVIGANTYFTYTQGLATLLVDTDITVTT